MKSAKVTIIWLLYNTRNSWIKVALVQYDHPIWLFGFKISTGKEIYEFQKNCDWHPFFIAIHFILGTFYWTFIIFWLFFINLSNIKFYSYFGDITDIGLKGISDIELCAGLCDKEGNSDLEIAVEEVEEECGYKVHPDQLEFVQKFCEHGARKMIYYVGKFCWLS